MGGAFATEQNDGVGTIIADAIASSGLESVPVVFGSDDETAREVRVALRDAAEEITEAHDWRALTRTFTIIGDGETFNVNLPSDFLRSPKSARVHSSKWVSYRHVHDADQWLSEGVTYGGVLPSYITGSSQISFRPAPAQDERVHLTYISSAYARNGTTLKTEFDQETDEFVLADRLLRLGLIYHLRAGQGLDFTIAKTQFDNAIQLAITRDKGARILTQASRMSWSIGAESAYPFGIEI